MISWGKITQIVGFFTQKENCNFFLVVLKNRGKMKGDYQYEI